MDKTVSLIDFFGKQFIIPHYQRGYRWERQEVEDLLDDLWGFEKSSNKGEFYCLQPIVLQEKDKHTYNVIDGQQRLTTLYLLLVFLEEMRIGSGYNQPLFALDYETRKDCRQFLEERKFILGDSDNTNIDYYHIAQAYKVIKDWFANPKHAGAKMKLVPILMDKKDKANRNVRFIWYEPDTNINPIDIFIRLNIGKIPLTDAELIKALLLQSDKYNSDELDFMKSRLFEIATEWDNIEYALQNEDFWYFLNNHINDKPTHIEFIFDLISAKIEKEKKYFDRKPLRHATFLLLSEYLQDLIENDQVLRIEAVNKVWEQVTEYFEYFKNWFQNRTLFHYIGFLIATRGSQLIDPLIQKCNELTKRDFQKFLENEIGRHIHVNKKRRDSNGIEYLVTLDKLNYENEDQQTNDRSEIHQILLLCNVFTTLKSEKEKARFPFNLYKHTKRNEKWSLEHIHAQNSEYITKKENQLTWLSDHIKSLSNQENAEFDELIERMKKLRDAQLIVAEDFEKIFDDVYSIVNKHSDLSDQNMHSLSNMCLVDFRTNSQLNNSVFDVKREIIKRRELQGFYIPVCTRSVFLKAYTEYPFNNAYWTSQDRVAYLESMKHIYDYFTSAIKPA